MMKVATAALLIAIVAVPLDGRAQQRPVAGEKTDTQKSPAVDASRLGVSLDRIRRELRQAEDREKSGTDELRLHFTVEVHGTAPKIDLLEGYSLVGPAPYGGPTHQDVLDVLTPQEFRSPVIPFSSLAYWAAEKIRNRSRRQRCEEELAEYKRLVMQGVAVAAPRCAQ